MKKEEFFQILKKKLAIIEENELKDILNEYEQHIAMKMENGKITEEEAIKDFGELDELVAEILESYHVKADYDMQMKEEKQERFKENAKELGENTKYFFEKFFHKMKTGLKKGWISTKTFIFNMVHRIQEIFSRSEKVENQGLLLDFTAEKQKTETIENSEEIFWEQEAKRKKFKSLPAFIKQIEHLFGKLFLWCVRLFLWGVRLCWNVCVIGLEVCTGAMAGGMIIFFGIIAVFVGMHYPLKGVLTSSFGIILLCVSVILFLNRIFCRKKEENSCLSDNKKKIYKGAMLFTFITGTLLGGIGIGVAVAEFSQFTYGGEQFIGDLKEVTKTVECAVPLEGLEQLEIGSSHIDKLEIVEDENIATGIVQYEVTGWMEEDVEWISEGYISEEWDEEALDYKTTGNYYVTIYQRYSPEKDLEHFMILKDKILKDIKNKEVNSYIDRKISKIVARVNPEMMQYIK